MSSAASSAASPSNVLVAMLPPDQACSESPAAYFGQFGEVAHIEMLAMPLPTFSVVYYDSRSASQAHDALGDVLCEFGVQWGSRTVRLPGDMNLDEADLGNVSNISNDLQESGTFLLEFFDIRDAARLQEVTSKAMSLVHSEISVNGLPNSVCNDLCMEAVLEQAGLEDNVVDFQVKQGKQCGELIVTIWGEEAASKCLKHFCGRQWDKSGAVVCASVLSVYTPTQEADKTLAFLSNKDEMKVPPVPSTPPPLPPPGLSMPPGLSSPPGLECFASDLSANLAAAFDVAINTHPVSAKKITKRVSLETENESSTDAGTSDGDQDDDCFPEHQVAAACV